MDAVKEVSSFITKSSSLRIDDGSPLIDATLYHSILLDPYAMGWHC